MIPIAKNPGADRDGLPTTFSITTFGGARIGYVASLTCMQTNPWKGLRHRLPSPHSGLSPHRTTHRDEALARRLYKTFEDDLELAAVRGLQFFVQNGTVTLFGTVRSTLDAELFTTLVRQVPGVKAVDEKLQVVDAQFQHEPASP